LDVEALERVGVPDLMLPAVIAVAAALCTTFGGLTVALVGTLRVLSDCRPVLSAAESVDQNAFGVGAVCSLADGGPLVERPDPLI
jgi:hypothetical protein